MPSDGSQPVLGASANPAPSSAPGQLSGRCYCGAVTFRTPVKPLTASYCHCADCRRWTGAPAAAFACFAPNDVEFCPDLGASFSAVPGVERWACPTCASPLAARFDYLPDQIYIPIGLFDQAEAIAPKLHSHADAALPWLVIQDDLPRAHASARTRLNAAQGASE